MAGWHSFPQSPGLRPGACMGLCCHRAAGIEAPSASWGTVTWRTKWPRAGLKRCRLSLGGMDGGVAFVPAVPGLAPWGFYKAREGVARANLDGLASKRRQDAEAQRARSERRQDAEANVRRDGTGNPDPPRTLLRANLKGLSTASRRPLDGLWSAAVSWQAGEPARRLRAAPPAESPVAFPARVRREDRGCGSRRRVLGRGGHRRRPVPRPSTRSRRAA